MIEFNIWDLWDYDNVVVKLKSGEIIQGNIICVDEFDEPDTIHVSIENEERITMELVRDIASITADTAEGKEVITRNKNGQWKKIKK